MHHSPRTVTAIAFLLISLAATAALAAAPGKFSDFTLVKVKGQATVYVIKGPYRNPVRSKVDFDKLGYRTYAVRTISAADLKPYKLGATLAHVPAGEGSLVTSASDKTVYLVEDGYRRPVAGPSVLAARGYSFREIKRLHPVQLEQLPLGARVTVRERRDGALVRTAKHPTVYLLENGQKKPVISAPAFETRGYRWEQVKVVRPAELDAYPTGETITDTAQPTLARVSSCDDLTRLVRQPKPATWRFDEFTEFSSDRFGAPASAGALGDTVNQGLNYGTIVGWGAPEAGRDFSTTNVQVAGVDEADVVKTDGTYLYALSVREVSISTATPPDQAKRLAVIAAAGPDFTPTDLFVAGNRLAVIGAVGPARHGDLDWLESALVEGRRVRGGPTRIAVYDIRDRAKPALVRTVEVDGSYQTARLIGNELYLVLQSSPAVRPLGTPAADGEQLLPTVRDGLGASLGDPRPLVSCDAVRYLNPIAEGTFVTVANLNLVQDARPLDALVILGGDSQVYVSRTNLYLARGQHNPSEGNRLRSLTQTNLYRIQLAPGPLALTGSAIVPGATLNQFSMDEHDGYVRIATTLAGGRWGSRSSAGVYVLDGDLRQVGAVENLAPGERIFAARFLGPKGYLVTFRQIDPLFTLDLADPAAPRLVGELKVAGFSTYLHPYDDTHLIGLGENTDDPELGTQAGIKLALFDLTDFARPVERFTAVVASGTAVTPAGADHRAFLFDRARQLLVIPVVSTAATLTADASGVSRRGEANRLDAYVYRLTLDQGFELKAKISHLPGGVLTDRDLAEPAGSTAAIEGFIQRALYVGNHLYTFSPGRWVITDLTTYAKVGEIRLEDLAGLLEEQLANARRQSRDTKRIADIKQVQTGFALYFNDHDAYPTAVAALALGSTAARCLSTTSGLAAVCTGTVYLSRVPADPQAPDRQYVLQPNSGDPTTYCIAFELETGYSPYAAGQLYATPDGLTAAGCAPGRRTPRPSY